MTYEERMEKILTLIGDTPVSEQIADALYAIIRYDYVPRSEFEALQATVDQLVGLVGDTPVAEQISAALAGNNSIN